MKFLSTHPYEDCPIGMRLISAIGTPGTITERLLVRDNDGNPHEPGFIISWENGKRSMIHHKGCDNIKIDPSIED